MADRDRNNLSPDLYPGPPDDPEAAQISDDAAAILAGDAVEQDLNGHLDAAASAGAARATNSSDDPAVLKDLDDELARKAEETIKTSIEEEAFDLEGDFLSQEEVSQILAEEANQALAQQDDSALFDAADFADTNAPETPDGVLTEPLAGEPADAPADPATEPASPVAAASDESAVSVEPSASASIDTPLAGRKPTAFAEEQPELHARPIETLKPPPASPKHVAPVPATPSPRVDQAIDAAEAELLESADASETDTQPSSPLTGWKHWLVRAARTLNAPFGWVPTRARDLIGLVGAVTCAMAIVVWVLAILR